MTHCSSKSIHVLNKSTIISHINVKGALSFVKLYKIVKCKKIQKILNNNIFAIIRLVLQITEHLNRNVQTSIVQFLQNILMQQY